MTDKQPTQEQIKKLWEKCGLCYHNLIPAYDYLKTACKKCGAKFENIYNVPYPPQDADLNNLFKYAVPKVIDKIMAEQGCSSDVAYDILFDKWLQKLQLDIPNHVGTLFQTIWEVIHGENTPKM